MHVSSAALDVTAESAGAHLYPDTWLFHFCDLGKGGWTVILTLYFTKSELQKVLFYQDKGPCAAVCPLTWMRKSTCTDSVSRLFLSFCSLEDLGKRQEGKLHSELVMTSLDGCAGRRHREGWRTFQSEPESPQSLSFSSGIAHLKITSKWSSLLFYYYYVCVFIYELHFICGRQRTTGESVFSFHHVCVLGTELRTLG